MCALLGWFFPELVCLRVGRMRHGACRGAVRTQGTLCTPKIYHACLGHSTHYACPQMHCARYKGTMHACKGHTCTAEVLHARQKGLRARPKSATRVPIWGSTLASAGASARACRTDAQVELVHGQN